MPPGKREALRGVAERNELVEENVALVYHVAKRFKNIPGVDTEDLVQEGFVNLIRSAESYRPGKAKFSTYVWHGLRGTMAGAIDKLRRSVVAPGHVSQEARKLENQRRKLSMELGRRASLQELADWMELPIQRIRRTRGKFLLRQKSFEDGVTWRTMSPDRRTRFDAVEDEENLEMIEEYDPALKHHLADERAENPEKTLESERARRAICVVLKTLPPRLETVIRMRFGLCDNEEGFTLDQIAEFFNLSRERIRQMEGKALRYLRHPKRSTKLKPAAGSYVDFWDILPEEEEKENEFTHWTGLLMHLSAYPKHIGATCNDCRKYIKFYKGKHNE